MDFKKRYFESLEPRLVLFCGDRFYVVIFLTACAPRIIQCPLLQLVVRPLQLSLSLHGALTGDHLSFVKGFAQVFKESSLGSYKAPVGQLCCDNEIHCRPDDLSLILLLFVIAEQMFAPIKQCNFICIVLFIIVVIDMNCYWYFIGLFC